MSGRLCQLSGQFRIQYIQILYLIITSAWSRKETEDYKNISIEDLTDSWGDGAAFCAIIHKYCPDLM